MAYSFNPASWTSGYSPSASDFQNIAADIAARGDNLDFAHYGAPNCAFVGLVPGDLPATSYTVTAGSWTGGTATLTIGSHNIQVNQHVSISSVTPTGYNSPDAVVTAVTGTTIKYAVGSNPGAWSSGGTVLVDRLATPATGMLAVDQTGALKIYNGSAWVSAASAITALTGDVTASGAGSVAATVAGLQGRAVSSSAPSSGQGLAWNGSAWAPATVVCGSIMSQATNTTTQAISTATATAVTFDTNVYDIGGVHSTSSNTSRFTVPASQGGYYLIQGSLEYANNATGSRTINIEINGSNTVFQNIPACTDGLATDLVISIVLKLNAGDYAELFAYHQAGTTLNITHQRMSITRLA